MPRVAICGQCLRIIKEDEEDWVEVNGERMHAACYEDLKTPKERDVRSGA